MPIDRPARLLNAEKLLRQGKLGQAIAEYERVVEEQPRDWNSANVLGDLQVRAGDTDKAVAQFLRIADGLNEAGFFPKAGALYKKVLKLRPHDERALAQAADIAARQGRVVEARAFFNVLADRLRIRGDRRGVAEILCRLGPLNPADFGARLAAARARTEIGKVAAAVSEFKDIAAELAERGRHAEAVDALHEVLLLRPEDDELVASRLVDIYSSMGDFRRAREHAKNAAQLKMLASRMEGAGLLEDVLATLRDAVRLDSKDGELRSRLASVLLAAGEVGPAFEHFSAAGAEAQLTVMPGTTERCAERLGEHVVALRMVVTDDETRREEITRFGCALGTEAPALGFALVDLAVESAAEDEEWRAAAAALEEFVARAPHYVPALLRLVEVCVDGGLETLLDTQARLADAYIASGSATRGRALAEDLLAQDPRNAAHADRLRKTLVLLGEPDPDGVVASLVSKASSVTRDEPRDDVFREFFAEIPQDFELERSFISNAFDPPGQGDDLRGSSSDDVEVDLSGTLDDILQGDSPVSDVLNPFTQPPVGDIEQVFARLRHLASADGTADAAEREYQRALALEKGRDFDGCVSALRAAARDPRLRFLAAAKLARMFRQRGDTIDAIDWFERAAEAPAPSADDAYELLYELADTLESTGEVARALAICIELRADAGEYRDVTTRVERLTGVQERG